MFKPRFTIVVALLCSLLLSLPTAGRSRASSSGKSRAKSSQTAASSKKSSGKSQAKSSKRARAAAANDDSDASSSRRGRRGKHGLKLPNPGPKRPRGQQSMSEERIREIQAALIREHLLEGEPTGQFDAATRQALADLQAANGWQTKYLPDARALIKLGLGPSHDGLLNPESAAIAPPPTTPRIAAPAAIPPSSAAAPTDH